MKKIILTFLSLSLYMSQAQAACDFIINIGDNKAKLVQKFTDPFPMFDNIFMLPIPSPQVCPNDNLDQDIAIEYIFIDDNLAAIRMVVFNDEKNNISNKLLLMNYAKKTYGDFDTGQNPKIFNNFYSWETLGNLVIYKRLSDPKGLIEEEIYISNEEYDYKLGAIYNQLEEIEDGKPEPEEQKE